MYNVAGTVAGTAGWTIGMLCDEHYDVSTIRDFIYIYIDVKL